MKEIDKKELEKKFEIINNIKLDGWENSYIIYKVINENNYKIGVEIGVAYGSHCDNILKNTMIDKLYGVDPYIEYSEYKGDVMCLSSEKMNRIFEFTEKRLSFYDGRFELIRKKSQDSFCDFEDNSLDFVYIDGNHFEEYIRMDLHNWWSKIKLGGIISGHDYKHGNFPFVTKIVDEFCLEKNIKLVYMGEHVWYAKK
jgi:hypothetical protein